MTAPGRSPPLSSPGLTLTTGESTHAITLTVTATDTETDTSAAATTSINVTVNEQADAPNLSAPATLTVDEGSTIALNISSSAAEADQNAPTILIGGVPSDATLSAGTNNHDGTWSLSAAQLSGLTLTTGESTHAITLTVTATDTETDTSAAATTSINVTVNEQADAPNLSAPATLTVDEGSTIALNISSSAAEADQNAPTILIGGVPGDATLSAGTNNHDGSWTLTAAQLSGLTLTTGESTHAITLTVTATDTETDTSAAATTSINVTVNEQADAPNLSAPATLTVDEGSTIALNISSSAAEADQNAPTILIGGVPSDATLSAAQLSGLTLTAGESTHSITLTVTATDTETDTSAFATKTINVTVNEQADAPNLTAPATLTMDEQGTVSLNIASSAAETDQNAPTIVISGVPADATLSAGTLNLDGTWSLSAAQLSGLTLTTRASPPTASC